MLQEKTLYPFKLVGRYQNVFAIFEDQRSAQIVGGVIIGIGTDQASHGAAQDGGDHVHFPLGSKIAGWRHDQLTGHRYDGTLHGHQQDNAGITHDAYGVHQPLNKGVYQKLLQLDKKS